MLNFHDLVSVFFNEVIVTGNIKTNLHKFITFTL